MIKEEKPNGKTRIKKYKWSYGKVGTDINNIVENEKVIMKTSKEGFRRNVLSTELSEDMVIKAESNENIINFTDRKSKIEAKKKVVDFESKKAEKDQDGRDAI